ncbi:odorant receptor 46a-like [Zophobas morio]|uniref:odorant receptor 46a-like n=1 Tax=Zophobas morio TaxID=2755281 RepID=UPI00308283FD
MEIFENKIFVVIQVFILVLHVILMLFNTYFFITEFSVESLTQYVSTYLVIVAVNINFATILWKRSAVREFVKTNRSYLVGLHNITPNSKDRILKECKYETNFVKLHLVLTLITGAVLIPVGKEREMQFAVLLFEKYYPLYVLEALYYMSFPIVAYVSVRLAYTIMYFVSHAKFQIYMLLEFIRGIVDDYSDNDDSELLNSEAYQNVVKERLQEMVTRITMLIKLTNMGSDLAGHFIPTMALSGVLMGLGVMSFVYLGEFFGYYCYLQNFMWCITSLSTLVVYVYYGQQIEDETELIFDAIYGVRWVSFNKSNRKIILVTLVNVQNPLKLQFTDNVACNYELGMKIYRNLYSFAAVMGRMSDFTENK